MRIRPFDYYQPKHLEEALTLLKELGTDAALLAGGTDLVVKLKQGLAAPRNVMALSGISDLKGISQNPGDGLSIGAMVSLRELAGSPEVLKLFPTLAYAAQKVASPQIRAAATVGGNLCLDTMCWYYNESEHWKRAKTDCYKAGGETCYIVNKEGVCYATYRGDLAPVLISLGARVRLASANGSRVIPLEKLYTGKGEQPFNLFPHELVTQLTIPSPKPFSGTAYHKYSHRGAVDFPLVSVAVALTLTPDRTSCHDAKIFLGAVGCSPLRASKAEEVLKGKVITEEVIKRASQAAASVSKPVAVMAFGSPAFRKKVAAVLTERAVTEAFERAR